MRKVLVLFVAAQVGCGGGSPANNLDTPEYRQRMREQMEKESQIRKGLKGAKSQGTSR